MSYKDPFHIPAKRLVVEHNGEEVMLLNKQLLDQQNAWENLELIKKLHNIRLNVEDLLGDTSGANKKLLLNTWTTVQFALQRAWGFPEDKNYHRFWDIPSCDCPEMDNDDRYPTGYYVVSGKCDLHGS